MAEETQNTTGSAQLTKKRMSKGNHLPEPKKITRAAPGTLITFSMSASARENINIASAFENTIKRGASQN